MYISSLRSFSYLPMTVLLILAGIPLFFVLMSIPKKKFAEMVKSSRKKEIKRRIEDVSDFIRPRDKILDVGCGNGKFGEALAKKFTANVCGVDVVDYANANIPIDFYDGFRLPFEDKSFDVIVLAMMLHHVRHQEDLIDEAIRCSRRAIIIYEDTYFSPWQRVAITWNDFYSNMVIGTVKIFKDLEGKGVLQMPLPFTFRCVKGWHGLFKQKSLTVQNTIVHHLGLKPHSKVTFLLKVRVLEDVA
jgi:SAM-dependent methyltransferase